LASLEARGLGVFVAFVVLEVVDEGALRLLACGVMY